MKFRLICKRKNDAIEFVTDGTITDMIEQIKYHVEYFTKSYLTPDQLAQRSDILSYEHRLMQNLQPLEQAQRLQKWALMGHTDTASMWRDYRMGVMSRISAAKSRNPQIFSSSRLEIQFMGNVYNDWISPNNTQAFIITNETDEAEFLQLACKIEYMQKLEAAVGQLKNWVSK